MVNHTNWFFAPERILFQIHDEQAYAAHVDAVNSLRLNEVALHILKLLEEPHTLDSLIQQVREQFEVDSSNAVEVITSFLEQLHRQNWICALPLIGSQALLEIRYLDLLKRALVNWIYPEHELQVGYLQSDHVAINKLERNRYLRDIRYREAEKFDKLLEKKRQGFVTVLSHTLVGLRRLNHLEYCARQIFANQISGDFFEAGVCQGGASIFLRALQVTMGEAHRITWAADSFEGLPVASAPQDEGLDFTESNFPWLAISAETVEENFRRYNLWSDKVRLVKGWFENSLPQLQVGPISLLRLDADLYQSTREVLIYLYDKVSPGGFIVVDDYGSFESCKLAIDDFRSERGISEPLKWIDWSGVWWQKTSI